MLFRSYGTSFIADVTGAIVQDAGSADEAVIVATVDRAANALTRAAWGLFRDRRPDLYGPLRTLDGSTTIP